MVHHNKVDCLVKKLDCSVVVKVTEKVQNSSEYSSRRYALSCWTFCNQTWYGDATSWAKVSCKKIGLLSSSSGSQWRLILSDMTVSTIAAEQLIFFATKFNWMVRYHKPECGEIGLLCSKSRSQQNFKMLMNVCRDDISSTAEPSVTKLGLVHHGPEYHARRLVCCLQVQGHSEGLYNQIWLFLQYQLFATKFNWMVHHCKLECFV